MVKVQSPSDHSNRRYASCLIHDVLNHREQISLVLITNVAMGYGHQTIVFKVLYSQNGCFQLIQIVDKWRDIIYHCPI
jgi:hypothetical protein